jgi:hypothetical protein
MKKGEGKKIDTSADIVNKISAIDLYHLQPMTQIMTYKMKLLLRTMIIILKRFTDFK